MKIFNNWCGRKRYRGIVHFLREIKDLITDFQSGDIFITEKGDVLMLNEESAMSWNVHGCEVYPSKFIGNIHKNEENIKAKIGIKSFERLKKELEPKEYLKSNY